MIEVASCADLIRILEQEAEELENLADDSADMQICLIERDWDNLEKLLARVDECSQKIRAIEEQRLLAYHEQCRLMGIPVAGGLAGLLPRVARDSERGKLRGLHRRMQVTALHIRSVGSGIERYVGAMIGTLHAVIDELYPTNRTYSHSGSRGAPAARALVVDRSL